MRRGLVALGLVTLLIVTGACGSSGSDSGSWSEEAVAATVGGAVRPVIANSQFGVGSNRLSIGVFNADGALVHNAAASVRLYALEGDRGELAFETELSPVRLLDVDHHQDQGLIPNARPPRYASSVPAGAAAARTPGHELPLVTLLVANIELTQPGPWGLELSVRSGSQVYDGLRLRFDVAERTPEPMLGEPVPRTAQTVLRDVEDIRQICTAFDPIPDLHSLTVAEALETEKPVVIGFATPSLCQSRFCGPIVEQVLHALYDRYRGQVEIVHIEPFGLAEAQAGQLVPVPAMAEWGLQTEPWVFIVDRDGRLAAKYEGVAGGDEVTGVLDQLLGR